MWAWKGGDCKVDPIFLNPNAGVKTLTREPNHPRMHFSLLPLAVSGTDLALTMALSGLVAGVIFGGLGMYFQHRRQAMWHETARLALEKGQPVPPSPDLPADESSPWASTGLPAAEARAEMIEQIRAQRIRGYMTGGLVNVAVGAGLFIALWQVSPATAYFAAIPGFIGIALVLVALFEVMTGRKSRD
jgi:hypothetical protein